MYIKPDNKMTYMYKKIYLTRKKEGRVKDVYIGTDESCRIYSKDSCYSGITDSGLMLEYVLFPIYLEGNTEIKTEVINVINEFINSNDILEYYQAFMFLSSEALMKSIYGDIPFTIFTLDAVKKMVNRLPDMENKLKNYRKGEFGRYHSSMYANVRQVVEFINKFSNYDVKFHFENEIKKSDLTGYYVINKEIIVAGKLDKDVVTDMVRQLQHNQQLKEKFYIYTDETEEELKEKLKDSFSYDCSHIGERDKYMSIKPPAGIIIAEKVDGSWITNKNAFYGWNIQFI